MYSVKCRSYDSNNRFIYVGVDISIYALLAGGRSSYPPVLVKLLYSRGYSGSLSTLVLYSVLLCYTGHGHVLYGTIIIKSMCVHHLYLQG